jgi:hypothetical protein
VNANNTQQEKANINKELLKRKRVRTYAYALDGEEIARDLEIHPRNSSLTIVNLESYYNYRIIIEIPFVRFKIVTTILASNYGFLEYEKIELGSNPNVKLIIRI